MKYKIIETATDNNPEYTFNKTMIYENVVLNEHSAIVAGLRDTTTVNAALESQAPLFIGLILGQDADNFINDRFDKYKKQESEALKDSGLLVHQLHDSAVNKTWLRLVNEAIAIFNVKYRVRSRAKIAVIDTVTSDGHPIVSTDLIEPMEVTLDDGDDTP